MQLMGSGTILREVHGGGGYARERFRRRRRRLERAELYRTPPRRNRNRALEHAPSDEAAAAQLRRDLSCRSPRAGRRRERLYPSFADQIRPYIPRRYRVLGTDGFGRSDYRARLRSFFEVDRYYVAFAALKSLADEEQVPASKVAAAIKKYNIDPEDRCQCGS